MRGKLWLTTNLKATAVRTSVNDSWRRFCGSVGFTANVTNDRQQMRN